MPVLTPKHHRSIERRLRKQLELAQLGKDKKGSKGRIEFQHCRQVALDPRPTETCKHPKQRYDFDSVIYHPGQTYTAANGREYRITPELNRVRV